MKCTKCQQGMIEKWKAITNNGKKGRNYKEYQRAVYWCSKDDIWISIEIPL